MKWFSDLEDTGYRKKFIWLPTKLKCDTRNVWIWWEYTLVKSGQNAVGEPVHFYKNLDGSYIE